MQIHNDLSYLPGKKTKVKEYELKSAGRQLGIKETKQKGVLSLETLNKMEVPKEARKIMNEMKGVN